MYLRGHPYCTGSTENGATRLYGLLLYATLRCCTVLHVPHAAWYMYVILSTVYLLALIMKACGKVQAHLAAR